MSRAQVPGCGLPGVSTICEGVGGTVSDAVGGAVNSGFESVANAMGEAAETILREVTTAWTRIPTGNAVSGGSIDVLMTDLRPIAAGVAVFGLIFSAGKMAFSRDASDIKTAGVGLLRVLLVGAAGLAVLQVAMLASDDVSRAILDQSAANGEFSAMVPLTSGALAPGLIFLLGILAIITGIIQIGLLVIRGAVIVVLAGTWQIAAAASITEGGSALWKKTSGWLLAWILYKPAAAVVYAAAFQLLMPQGGEPTVLEVTQGLLLLVLAVLALPAMLKLVAPAVSAMGGGPSTAGLVAGTAAVATGAAALVATGGASAAAGAGAGGAAAGGGAGAGGGAAAGGGGMAGGADAAAGAGSGSGGGGGSSASSGSATPPGGGSGGDDGGGPSGADTASTGGGGSAGGGSSGGSGAGSSTPAGQGGGGSGDGPSGSAATSSGGGSAPPPPAGTNLGGSGDGPSPAGPSGAEPTGDGGGGAARGFGTAASSAAGSVASGADDLNGDDDDGE